MFYTTAGIYVFGTIVFAIFGSGKRQRWADQPVQKKKEEEQKTFPASPLDLTADPEQPLEEKQEPTEGEDKEGEEQPKEGEEKPKEGEEKPKEGEEKPKEDEGDER